MYRRNEISKAKYYSALFILAGLVLSLGAPKAVRVSAWSGPDNARNASSYGNSTAGEYGKTSLLFEKNEGQADKQAKFIARGQGYTLYLADAKAVFSLKTKSENPPGNEESAPKGSWEATRSDTVTMHFAGANEAPAIEGATKAVTKTNYYIGKKRIENVPNYRQVSYKNLYEGIDAVFYGNQADQLEYDFQVAPGADAGQVRLNFEGAESTSINENGDLIVKTGRTELIQHKPVSFQEIDGQRTEVASRYVVSADNTVSIELGDYDHSKKLVIDPALTYLTYIGGTDFESIFEIAVDNNGSAYISGTTDSLNFHGQQRAANDKTGAFVAKLDPQGANFVYITILEGNGDDDGRGIALNANNEAYVTGVASHFFPATSGSYDSTHGTINNDDAFAAKLSSSGTLVYATFLGGNDEDEGFDIAVDPAGKAYVVGFTYSNIAFPSKNKYQGCGFVFPTSLDSIDAFLTVLNASGSDITYSTCIGGSVTEDQAFSVALDSSNNAYLTGLAKGGNFPTKNAAQAESGGGIDAWVAKFNPASSGEASLVYSTYLGGVGTDQGNAVAVNASGQAHIVGLTGSVDFPLQNAFRTTNQVNEAFVTVLNANGASITNSSFLGGSDQDNGLNIALGNAGLIYVTGSTLSNNFPMGAPFQATRAGLRDAFVTKLKFGRGVISSSYLGGAGTDIGNGIASNGRFIFVAGQTQSGNLATTAGVVKGTSNAGSANPDGFVARILDTTLDSVGAFRPGANFILTQSTTTISGQAATLTAPLSGERGVAGDWDGDALDSIGTFTAGTWKVRNTNFPLLTPPVTTISFGAAGDLPVAGDWDGDGFDTPGVFRPSTGQFTLTDSTAANPSFNTDVTRATFGTAGDLPISGDWNGDGKDSVAVYRPSTGETFFTDDDLSVQGGVPVVLNPAISFVAFLGITEDLPMAGDWNADGKDTLGLYRPSTAEFILSDDNVNLRSVFVFGQPGSQPIAGDWDGKPLP